MGIKVYQKLNSTNVTDVLSDLFILHGATAFIRSGSGPKFIAQSFRGWIAAVGAKTAHVELGRR